MEQKVFSKNGGVHPSLAILELHEDASWKPAHFCLLFSELQGVVYRIFETAGTVLRCYACPRDAAFVADLCSPTALQEPQS